MAKSKLFIGSSTEVRTRGILPKLVAELSRAFDVQPWHNAFDQGSSTLETLLRLTTEIDLALLVFANDDGRDLRGKADQVTRDNVILECGLFLASLGKERVWILKEAGVNLPTDLSGWNHSIFRSTNPTMLYADLEICVNDICAKWSLLPPRVSPDKEADVLDDSNLGLAMTLKRIEHQVKETTEQLRLFAQDERAKVDRAFPFEGIETCIVTYAEALNLVKKRFWTTTYLSSGFWTQRHAQVNTANSAMLKRLQDGDGEAHRLILLSRSPIQEAEARKQEWIYARQRGDEREIARLEREIETVKDNISRLVREGCIVGVVFDEAAHERLVTPMVFKAGDSELAIYDDFRVDIFGGGQVGHITSVQIYSKAMLHFDAILGSATEYFESLWRRAEPYDVFLQRLDDAHSYAMQRIDYAPNWLATYERALPAEDLRMKHVEMEQTRELLRSRGLWGQIKRYLDIGTCTARYPIELREAVRQDGEIIGIDNDPDCVRFANANQQQETHGDKRITIRNIDYGTRELPDLGGPFDVITCMLGTLSHFGWRSTPTFDDLFQRVLLRTAQLLSEDGLFIFSVWSQSACRNLQMLGIYRDQDRKRLAEWTPTPAELKRRLDAAGFVVVRQSQPDDRLDLFVCQRRTASPVVRGIVSGPGISA